MKYEYSVHNPTTDIPRYVGGVYVGPRRTRNVFITVDEAAILKGKGWTVELIDRNEQAGIVDVPQAVAAGTPGYINFNRSNTKRLWKMLMNVKSGNAQGRLLTLGDSTNFGQGAGTGATGIVGCRAKSYPAFLAKFFASMGIAAAAGALMGSGGLVQADYLLADPRLTLTGGWGVSSVTSFTRTWTNSTTTTALNFTPTETFDRIEIGYLQNSGYGTFTVGVDGGAAAATINAAGAQAMMKTTVNVTRGTHTINIARNGTGAGVHIAYIIVYDSTAPSVQVLNCGWTGAYVSTWDVASSPWSPGNAFDELAADVAILDLGINNWRATPPVDVATFKTQYQNTISRLKAVGDVILLGPAPSDLTAASTANQAAYLKAIYELSEENNIPLIDLTVLFESHAAASALGFYFDTLHPSAPGYAAMAEFIGNALMPRNWQ